MNTLQNFSNNIENIKSIDLVADRKKTLNSWVGYFVSLDSTSSSEILRAIVKLFLKVLFSPMIISTERKKQERMNLEDALLCNYERKYKSYFSHLEKNTREFVNPKTGDIISKPYEPKEFTNKFSSQILRIKEIETFQSLKNKAQENINNFYSHMKELLGNQSTFKEEQRYEFREGSNIHTFAIFNDSPFCEGKHYILYKKYSEDTKSFCQNKIYLKNNTEISEIFKKLANQQNHNHAHTN